MRDLSKRAIGFEQSLFQIDIDNQYQNEVNMMAIQNDKLTTIHDD